MPKQSLNTIKNWFKTTFTPTQLQFWDVFDSFFHKDDEIPTNRIEGLDDRFDEKADSEAFINHINDPHAHGIGALILNLKTEILAATTDDIVIDWQNEVVPGDVRTFAQKHGNNIGMIQGVFDDEGAMTSYKPNYSYYTEVGQITTLTIKEVFIGTITII